MEHMIIESKSPLIIHFFYEIFPSIEHLCRGRPHYNNVRYQVIVCQGCLAYSTDEGVIPLYRSFLDGKILPFDLPG